MARIQIQGLRPYDGEYELDSDRVFNAREWRWIKKISGYLPATIRDGFVGRDPDLFVALAVIAMCRDGKIDREDGLRVADVIAEAPFDQLITLVGDEVEEGDGNPPELTSEPEQSSPKSSLEKRSSSGDPSPTGSGTSEETPSATGALSSPMSSGESSRVRLAS